MVAGAEGPAVRRVGSRCRRLKPALTLRGLTGRGPEGPLYLGFAGRRPEGPLYLDLAGRRPEGRLYLDFTGRGTRARLDPRGRRRCRRFCRCDRLRCQHRLVHHSGIIRPHRRHQVVDRRRKNLEERLGIQADPEGDQHQRNQGREFSSRKIEQLLVLWVFHLAEEDR